MIGYYDYSVSLTYLNVISAIIGMYYALNHNMPMAIICLILSGICDMFDGTVARLKIRTEREKNYGMEIDSLADIISFGIFPVIIGYSLGLDTLGHMFIHILYVLTALIRLAYFNVTEMELKKISDEPRKFYEGLPVTSIAIIIPFIYFVSSYFNLRFESIYFVLMPVLSIAFISRFKIIKQKLKHLIIYFFIGIIAIKLILVSGGQL